MMIPPQAMQPSRFRLSVIELSRQLQYSIGRRVQLWNRAKRFVDRRTSRIEQPQLLSSAIRYSPRDLQGFIDVLLVFLKERKLRPKKRRRSNKRNSYRFIAPGK